MPVRLTLSTLVLLTLPPLLWACNALIGRWVHEQVPPMTLNLLRWLLALLILLPLAHGVLRRSSPMWAHWRRISALGLLSIGAYNALQYLALQTSTPINVTLVASSMPVWMLVLGRVLHGVPIRGRQMLGALLSIAGVLLVLSRGQWQVLVDFRFVPGDGYVLLATLAWALYSWMLARPAEPAELRNDWAAFLTAQVFFGLGWSTAFAAGEWAFTPAHIDWSWNVVGAIVFIAVGPAVLAYRCWGAGIQRVGPQIAGFFTNLTPLFAALLSTVFLGEAPRLFHFVAFALIVGGIVVSSRR
jgi:drug/metabolite transporter (DMT)-like permease